jgi:hypothetical protein
MATQCTASVFQILLENQIVEKYWRMQNMAVRMIRTSLAKWHVKVISDRILYKFDSGRVIQATLMDHFRAKMAIHWKENVTGSMEHGRILGRRFTSVCEWQLHYKYGIFV